MSGLHARRPAPAVGLDRLALLGVIDDVLLAGDVPIDEVRSTCGLVDAYYEAGTWLVTAGEWRKEVDDTANGWFLIRHAKFVAPIRCAVKGAS